MPGEPGSPMQGAWLDRLHSARAMHSTKPRSAMVPGEAMKGTAQGAVEISSAGKVRVVSF